MVDYNEDGSIAQFQAMAARPCRPVQKIIWPSNHVECSFLGAWISSDF